MDEKKGSSKTADAQKKPVKTPSSTKTLTPDPNAAQKVRKTETADKVKGKNGVRERSKDKKELASSQKEMKAGADLENAIFDEVSSQFDQLFPEEEKSKPTQKISGKTSKKEGSKPAPAVTDTPKAKKISETDQIKAAKKEPIFQSVFNELEDGTPPKKDQKKPPKVPPEKKSDKVVAEAGAQPEKAKKRDVPIAPKDSGPKPKGSKETKMQVSKPTPAAKETARTDKEKIEKKEYVIPYAADESKKEPPPKAPSKPPLIPKKKKPEKITIDRDTQADKAQKKVVTVDTKDSRAKPQVVPPTKKKVGKPLLPAQETPKARKPAKADKKKEDQTVDRKKPVEKIAVKAAKKKPSYKAYVLFGTLVVVGIVIALSPFGPVQLFKKKEPPQKRTTQKIIKMPLKPQEKKVVPVKKKPVVSTSPSVEKKDKAPPLKLEEKKVATITKKSVDKSPVPVAIQGKVLPSKKKPNLAGEVNAFLMKWKAAWEHSAGVTGDIETYMSLYSDDFYANGLDKNGWKQDKARKNKNKDWIRIGIKNINIVGKPEGRRFAVNFIQDYQSSNYAGVSEKTLLLKKEKSGWKIAGIQTATRSYPHSASYPYSIHMGSYRSIQSAQQTIRDHQLMGLQTFWVRVDLGEKGVWYRVFSGCYKNSEAAEKIIKAKQLQEGRPERTEYANFIGTYSSGDHLKNQNRSLSKYGYAPYYIKDSQGKFHLFVGAFYAAKNAKKLYAELKSKGIRSQVVKR